MSRDAQFTAQAALLGYSFDGEIQIGGNYVTVYVQSAATFTQQSEVADAASAVLHAVLGPAGAHARTSVGVFQLPKNATVELDLIATVVPGITP
jgi:hypothetical protein